MGYMKELRQDYRLVLEGIKEARAEGDTETAQKLSADFVKIADQMERFCDE